MLRRDIVLVCTHVVPNIKEYIIFLFVHCPCFPKSIQYTGSLRYLVDHIKYPASLITSITFNDKQHFFYLCTALADNITNLKEKNLI